MEKTLKRMKKKGFFFFFFQRKIVEEEEEKKGNLLFLSWLLSVSNEIVSKRFQLPAQLGGFTINETFRFSSRFVNDKEAKTTSRK